eukprot:1150489-Pelagomonas_calceolata.AAC.3
MHPEDRDAKTLQKRTCTASFRVGPSTSSWGPWRKSLWPAFLMCIMPGSKKPHVLPLPVYE